VIISSGFAEQFDGAERERELREAGARYPGMRLLGPNAEGLINVVDDIPVGFSPTIDYRRALVRLRAGDVAVVAQSGGLGFALFNDGLSRGLGFSHVLSTGNEVDLDLASWRSTCSTTRRPGCCCCSSRARRPGAADRARGGSRGPGQAVRGGEGRWHGRRPAGRAGAHRARCRRRRELRPGAVRTWSAARRRPGADDRLRAGAVPDPAPGRPAGRRRHVSGGAGTWLADDLVSAGLDVPVLGLELQRRLRELIPAYGSPVNPVDATAQVLSTGGVGPVVRLLVDSGEVDAVVLVKTLADPKQLDRERAALVELAAALPLVIYSYTRPAPASVTCSRSSASPTSPAGPVPPPLCAP